MEEVEPNGLVLLSPDLLGAWIFESLGWRSRCIASTVCRVWHAGVLESSRIRWERLSLLLGIACHYCDAEPPMQLPEVLPPSLAPQLEQGLRSADLTERTFAAWALGVVGGSSVNGRRAMLESSLAHLLAFSSPFVASALNSLCRTRPHPLTVQPALPLLVSLLYSDDTEECADALDALTHLCSKPRLVALVFSPGDAIYECIIELASHPQQWIHEGAVRLVGAIARALPELEWCTHHVYGRYHQQLWQDALRRLQVLQRGAVWAGLSGEARIAAQGAIEILSAELEGRLEPRLELGLASLGWD